MKKRIIRYATIALVFVLIITIGSIGCRKSRINKIEANLGISIPAWTRVSGTTDYLGQDYIKELNLKFTEKGLKELLKQIEQTKYFNSNQNFYDRGEWKKSDTAFYDSVKAYLRDKHLTGYWIKSDTSTYIFHEPYFGDIPNSAILFDEGYEIEAIILVKEKKMEYRFIKY